LNNMLHFLLGYMEDTHTVLLEENKEIAAIVAKHLEALKKDLNDRIDFFPVFFPIDND